MKVPYDFLRRRVALTWTDIAVGLQEQLISPSVAIEEAVARLSGSASSDELELAGRSLNEPILDLVLRLAENENVASGEESQAKWLYLVLAWLFENRQALYDPLDIVEWVYADFEYPPEMAPFVRYMPMVGPDLGSRERNEARMYVRWQEYLDVAGRHFSRSG